MPNTNFPAFPINIYDHPHISVLNWIKSEIIILSNYKFEFVGETKLRSRKRDFHNWNIIEDIRRSFGTKQMTKDKQSVIWKYFLRIIRKKVTDHYLCQFWLSLPVSKMRSPLFSKLAWIYNSIESLTLQILQKHLTKFTRQNWHQSNFSEEWHGKRELSWTSRKLDQLDLINYFYDFSQIIAFIESSLTNQIFIIIPDKMKCEVFSWFN